FAKPLKKSLSPHQACRTRTPPRGFSGDDRYPFPGLPSALNSTIRLFNAIIESELQGPLVTNSHLSLARRNRLTRSWYDIGWKNAILSRDRGTRTAVGRARCEIRNGGLNVPSSAVISPTNTL